MCCVDKMYCHFPERVKRQYRYVHDIPRPPIYVHSIRDAQAVKVFPTFVSTPFPRINGVNRWICCGGTRKDIWYGMDGCLPQRFFHLFRDLIWGKWLRSRSLHTSSNTTRREAHLIPFKWWVVMLAKLLSIWFKRGWAQSNCIRPCAMLGRGWHPFWPEGSSRTRRSRTSWCVGLVFSFNVETWDRLILLFYLLSM